jgi:FkbM family methyltransferase
MLFQNILYNILLEDYPHWDKSKLAHWLWGKVRKTGTDVTTQLHGSKVLLPADHNYPLITRLHNSFNNPYLELVYQVWKQKDRKLFIADIGAGVGDTFLFIQKNIPQAIQTIFCVEAFPSFLKYLEHNTDQYPEAKIVDALLSENEEEIPSLQKLHSSTAGSSGLTKQVAKSFDQVWAEYKLPSIDILKTDVEGYDGKVLAGAKEMVIKHHPAVIFEFHPLLIQQSGNDVLNSFQVLADAGYEQLLWFTKFGEFCFQLNVKEQSKILEYANRCLNGLDGEDCHYDIIALPINSDINIKELKQCEFSSAKLFPY